MRCKRGALLGTAEGQRNTYRVIGFFQLESGIAISVCINKNWQGDSDINAGGKMKASGNDGLAAISNKGVIERPCAWIAEP